MVLINQRLTRLIPLIFAGSSLGAGLTFPMCGYIIANYGWELVFHVCGIIGCVWYVFWHLLVFDTPAEHPRISNSEKEFIQKSLGRSVSTEKVINFFCLF